MATDKPVTHHVLAEPFLQPEPARGWPVNRFAGRAGEVIPETGYIPVTQDIYDAAVKRLYPETTPGPGDAPIEPSGGEEATDALTIAKHAQRRANFAHDLIGDMNADRMRDQDDVSAMARQADAHFHRLYLGVVASLVLGSANLVLFIVSLLIR